MADDLGHGTFRDRATYRIELACRHIDLIHRPLYEDVAGTQHPCEVCGGRYRRIVDVVEA